MNLQLAEVVGSTHWRGQCVRIGDVKQRVGKCRPPVMARLTARLLVAYMSVQLYKVNSSAATTVHRKPSDPVVSSLSDAGY